MHFGCHMRDFREVFIVYTDYPNLIMLLFAIMYHYNFLMRMQYFTKLSHLCSIYAQSYV